MHEFEHLVVCACLHAQLTRSHTDTYTDTDTDTDTDTGTDTEVPPYP